MRSGTHWLAAAALAAIVALPDSAAAQAADAGQTAAPTPSNAPLVIERIESPFVMAPDYKVTDLDGELGQLAGAYAGRLIDGSLLIGGAAYWMPDGRNGNELTYGGALVGWSSGARHRIRFGGRALVGIGRAELATDVTPQAPGRLPLFAQFGGRSRQLATPVRSGGPSVGSRLPSTFVLLIQDDFFVFEPQANVFVKLTDVFGLDWTAGYRQTALSDALRDRLNGLTGGVALRVTW